MRMYTEKTLNKYQDIVKQNFISEKDLIGLRSFINNKLRHDRDLRIQLCNQSGEKNMSEEHQQKGLSWLKSKNILKSGLQSKSSFLGQLEMSILRNAKSIKFAYLLDLGYGQISNLQPVYRVEDSTGRWFSYCGTTIQEVGV